MFGEPIFTLFSSAPYPVYFPKTIDVNYHPYWTFISGGYYDDTISVCYHPEKIIVTLHIQKERTYGKNGYTGETTYTDLDVYAIYVYTPYQRNLKHIDYLYRCEVTEMMISEVYHASDDEYFPYNSESECQFIHEMDPILYESLENLFSKNDIESCHILNEFINNIRGNLGRGNLGSP